MMRFVAECRDVSADRVAGPDHARRTGVLDLPFEQAGKESFGLLAVAAANFKMTD
jgi:hypothetical protein